MSKISEKIKNYFPGFILVVMLGVLCKFVSTYILIGSVATAIIASIIVSNLIPINTAFKPGISFCSNNILNIAIVLMGVQLNLTILEIINFNTILIIISIIIIAIICSLILGKLFKLSNSLSLLIGIGNGICGSSAIAGASSIIHSKKEDIGISISTINILGALGIFLVPGLISLLEINNTYEQSMIIGSTIQAMGQVTAAGFVVGDDVGRLATLIKMVRIIMLGPTLILLSYFFNKSNNKRNINTIFSIPPFIIGFLLLSIISSFNIIPDSLVLYITIVSKYLLIFAMVGIGLSVSISSIYDKGLKVFFVSFITFLIQIFFCIHFVT